MQNILIKMFEHVSFNIGYLDEVCSWMIHIVDFMPYILTSARNVLTKLGRNVTLMIKFKVREMRR